MCIFYQTSRGVATLVGKDCQDNGMWKCDTAVMVETVTLDDIPRLPELHTPIKSAILKMDIEGHERNAILSSKKMFLLVSLFENACTATQNNAF